MLEELGISGKTAIIILIVLYFVIKWAVRNGIREAYEKIIGKRWEELMGKDMEDDWGGFLGEDEEDEEEEEEEEEENKGAKK